MNIPKIIHQIWLGPNKLPSIWIDSWRKDYIKQYPDWEYKLWREEDINQITMINREFYDKEKHYNGKSDIARYEILNQFGGLFIDADSLWIPKHSLDIVLDQCKEKNVNFFCAKEPNGWFVANGVIGSEQNNVILSDCIDFINNNYSKLKKTLGNHQKQIWRITGTHPFTQIIYSYNDDQRLLLPNYYFYPTSFHQNNLGIDIKTLPKKFPENIMMQYGYSTNNLSKNNVMKKFIDKTK